MEAKLDFTLAPVADPKVKILGSDKTVKEFDPWDLFTSIEDAMKAKAKESNEAMTISEHAGLVRTAIGVADYPIGKCMELSRNLRRFVEGFAEAGK